MFQQIIENKNVQFLFKQVSLQRANTFKILNGIG
jgi:hypothetical protein